MNRILLCFALLFSFTATAVQAAAPSSFKIIAEVNEEAISNFALNDRINFIIKTSNLPNDPSVRSQIAGQALQTMINEILQRQHAQELGLKISDGEMKRAVSEIEQQNNLKPGQFDAYMRQMGLPKDGALNQIRSQMLWKKIVSRRITPRVYVDETEIKDAAKHIDQIKEKAPPQMRNREIMLYEIVLPVDKGKSAEGRKTAASLIAQIQKGASFEQLARQFSNGASASDGGKIGWIEEAQLRGELQQIVAKVGAGTVLPPIEGEDFIRIIKVGQVRGGTAVAAKETAPAKITPERIKNVLMMKKVELEAQRYMKKLRREAYIEVRI